jgi:hypothetical protein
VRNVEAGEQKPLSWNVAILKLQKLSGFIKE